MRGERDSTILGENATLTLNIDGKRIENDVTFFRDVNASDFNSAKKITINFNNVYGPNYKWIRLLSNNDNCSVNFSSKKRCFSLMLSG